jgi:HEAT repeat protein
MNDRKISFDKVLEALQNEGQPFPKQYLYEFSDIEPEPLKSLLAAWPDIIPNRKLSILKSLEDLAEHDTMLSFDELGRTLLKDEDSRVRRQAIRLLFECDDVKLVPTYLKLMADEQMETRAEAATALGQFVKMGELDEISPEVHQQIEDALLEVLTSEDETIVRQRALESLGYSSRPEVTALLESAYSRENPDWTASALFAMGRSCDERWQENVIRMLLSENRKVRLAATQAAGELEIKAARKILLHMLEEEEDELVLSAAIWSLSQIGGEDVRTYLESLLDQTESDEQAAYVEEALDNLTFTEEMQSFDLFAFDPDDELDELDEIED